MIKKKIGDTCVVQASPILFPIQFDIVLSSLRNVSYSPVLYFFAEADIRVLPLSARACCS